MSASLINSQLNSYLIYQSLFFSVISSYLRRKNLKEQKMNKETTIRFIFAGVGLVLGGVIAFAGGKAAEKWCKKDSKDPKTTTTPVAK